MFFSGSKRSFQEPLVSYYIWHGYFPQSALGESGHSPHFEEQLRGRPGRRCIGDYAFSSTKGYVDKQILYKIVVPAIAKDQFPDWRR